MNRYEVKLCLGAAICFGLAIIVILFSGCNINNPADATYPWIPAYYPPDAGKHIHDASIDAHDSSIYDAGAMDN